MDIQAQIWLVIGSRPVGGAHEKVYTAHTSYLGFKLEAGAANLNRGQDVGRFIYTSNGPHYLLTYLKHHQVQARRL